MVGPWGMKDEPAPPYRRSPRGERSEHVLLRTVECVHGSVEVVAECQPRFAYGGRAVSWAIPADGEARASVAKTCSPSRSDISSQTRTPRTLLPN